MAKVRDIMQKNVITIEKTKKAQDAAIILKDKEISFLVVVNDNKPIGIVSERDIVSVVSRSRAEPLALSSLQPDQTSS